MGAPETPPVHIPQSYAEHAAKNFSAIKLVHHPESAPIATEVIILELHRPKANNAWTEQMGDEMVRSFKMFDVDDRVKVIIVTAKGRFFCPGADLNIGFGAGGPRERLDEHRDAGGRCTTAIHQCRKPVIAALNGSAVGIGITMTMPMAIRIAPKNAKIGLVFGRRGLVMEAASSFYLPKLIGYSRAIQLITTGAIYTPNDKILDGLFAEVVDTPEQVMPKALQIAEDIAQNVSSVSFALMRDMIWRAPPTAEETHLLDSKIFYELARSRDNAEGVKSFMEKRPPKFVGNMYQDAPTTYPWWKPVDVVYRARGKLEEPKL